MLLAALSLIIACKSPPHLPVFSKNDYLKNTDMKLNATVRLSANNQFFCSAVIISEKYAVTAGHCWENGEIEVQDSQTTTKTTAQFVAKGRRLDIALLVGDFSKFNCIPIPDNMAEWLSAVKSENTILTCGYPEGGAGVCQIVKILRMNYFSLEGTGVLQPGQSGGPLINASTGLLIGINSYAGVGVSGYTPTIELFNMLDVVVE